MSLNHSTIQWIHPDPKRRFTSNPIWGCGNGCPYCYARAVAKRFGMGNFNRPKFYPDRLTAIARKLAPKTENVGVFLCSMSDPFAPGVNPRWLGLLIETVRILPQHTFFILTKKPNQIMNILVQAEICGIPDNLTLGVSVEDRSASHRIAELLSVWPGRTMVSYEPILGPPPEIPTGVDWIVLGGLSPKTRWLPPGWSSMQALHEASAVWAQEVIDQARAVRIPVFVKTHPAQLPGLEPIREWPEGWVTHPTPKPQPKQPSIEGLQARLF